MTYNFTLSTTIAPLALASMGLCSTGFAQADYSHNWQTMNYGFNGALTFAGGQSLWGGISGGTSLNGILRICYGVDATQGGSNEGGMSALSWFKLVQGHGAGMSSSSAALVSGSASAYDAASGDACWAPALDQFDPHTGAALKRFDSTSFLFANLTFGGSAPAPTFWFSYFQLFDGNGESLASPNVLGSDPGSPFPDQNPLLTHMVMEIQGPANQGPGNIQYYLATTDEIVGPDGGGVTNGNLSQGEAVFGLGYTADLTGAVTHSRLFAFNQATGTLSGVATLGFGGLATDQWLGSLAFNQPSVWAGNDVAGDGTLNTGAGGMDWRISQSVSTVQLRVLDMLSGAEAAGLPIDAAGGPPSSQTDSGLVASAPFFMFSGTQASGTYQRPCGWCDFGGQIPMQPSDPLFGPIATVRKGNQGLPVCFDSLTLSFLSNSGFATGSNFRGAYDPNVDSGLTSTSPSGAAWPFESLFDCGVGVGIAGSASMQAPLPISQQPNPLLAGRKLCVTALLVRADANLTSGEISIGINEIANVASINLQ